MAACTRTGRASPTDASLARRLRLDEGLLEELRRPSLAAAPREACGVWYGRALGVDLELLEVCVLDNIAGEPDAFELDPGQLRAAFDAQAALGLDLLGVWHSHPASGPRPSVRDLAGTPPGLCQLIVAGESAQQLGAWWRSSGGFRRLELSWRRSGAEISRQAHPVDD